MRKKLNKKTTINQRIEQQYTLISTWALARYGVQDSLDYVHTAVVAMLEDIQVCKLSDIALLGHWRILIHDAYCKEQLSRKNLSGYDVAELASDESHYHARQWIKKLLPGLPAGQRKLIYHLALQGETYAEVGQQLGWSTSTVFRVYQTLLGRIGKQIQQENEVLNCSDIFLPV